MSRFPVSYLAAGAFGLIASAAAGAASGQANSYQTPPAPWSITNPPPINSNLQANQAAMDAPQLFKFTGLTNKSTAPCTGSPSKAEGRPKVVATFPGEGTMVRPGVVVVRVTFDQPMSCDASFDGASDLPNPCPGRWRQATLSQDRRSFRTVCEVQPNTRYRLTLRSFHNSHGLALPREVTFVTSGAEPIATIQQALAEDVGIPVAGG